MKKHLHRLGIIYTVYGWFLLCITILAGLFATQDIRRIRGCEKDVNQTLVLPNIFYIIIAIIAAYFIMSLFFLLFGKALKNERAWATRVAGFIIGVLLLFQFPIGTIIGGYTLWVLSKLDQSTLKQTQIK